MRPILEQTRIHPAIHDKIANLHQEILREVQEAIDKHDIVVVGMAINPHPKRAKKALEAKGLAYEYLEYGSYLSRWRPRTALKMWTGWPTFPMIFIKRTFIGGADDLIRLIESGELERLLGAEPAGSSRTASAVAG